MLYVGLYRFVVRSVINLRTVQQCYLKSDTNAGETEKLARSLNIKISFSNTTIHRAKLGKEKHGKSRNCKSGYYCSDYTLTRVV